MILIPSHPHSPPPEHEPLPTVKHVEIGLTLAGLRYTFQVGPSVTIQSLKQTLSPMISYLPEHFDILLSKEAPYPLSEKLVLHTLATNHRALLIQPCGPVQHSFAAYVKPNAPNTLDLQQMAAVDIPYLSFWVRSPSVHGIIISSDHPRALDILETLQEALAAKTHSVKDITVTRRAQSTKYPITKAHMDAFVKATDMEISIQG
jgi:hypothetical protein